MTEDQERDIVEGLYYANERISEILDGLHGVENSHGDLARLEALQKALIDVQVNLGKKHNIRL